LVGSAKKSGLLWGFKSGTKANFLRTRSQVCEYLKICNLRDTTLEHQYKKMKFTDLVTEKYSRSIRELIVLFISIVLAFLFEDYRENKNENNAYKKTLVDFTEELIDDMEQRRIMVDSFRVKSGFSGRQQEDVLDLIWFESKLDSKTATMADVEYLISSGNLSPNIIIGNFGPSPLAEELRTKFSDQINNPNLVKWLRSYEAEMMILVRFNKLLQDSHESLNKMIEKTNPYFRYSKQDSLLVYSNEFIWRYKDIVRNRESELWYNKLLVENRLKKVYKELKKEYELQGLPLDGDHKCAGIDSFRERFVCENGRQNTPGDSLQTMSSLVKKKREDFMEERAKRREGIQP